MTIREFDFVLSADYKNDIDNDDQREDSDAI